MGSRATTILAALLFVVLGATCAGADPWISFNGNKALDYCHKNETWCFGYSMATVETASGIDAPVARFCLPDNMTGG